MQRTAALIVAVALSSLPALAVDKGPELPSYPPLAAPEGGVPVNDACANAIAIPAIPAIVSGTTLGANLDPEAGASCGTSISTGGVWYTVPVPANGSELTLSTCCSAFGSADYDSKISVFTGDCAQLNCIDGNDDNCGNGVNVLSSTVTIPQLNVTQGEVYHVLVHGFGSAQGNFQLSVFEGPADLGRSCTTANVPAVAPWGLVALGLALLGGGLLMLRRRRTA